MGMLHRFDITTSNTQFFLVIFLVLLVVTVAMTRVTKKRKMRRYRVDDRFVNREGELIE